MKLTPFDSFITNDFLQILKVMIPYLPAHLQKVVGIYIKMTELSYIIAQRKFPLQNTPDINHIFSDIEPYLPDSSRHAISEFQQFFDMFEMMQSMNMGDMDLSSLFQFEGSVSYERMDESSSNEEA